MEADGGKDTLGYEIFQWDHLTVAREPDMIAINKNKGKCIILTLLHLVMVAQVTRKKRKSRDINIWTEKLSETHCVKYQNLILFLGAEILNSASLQNFHTRKLREILVFYGLAQKLYHYNTSSVRPTLIYNSILVKRNIAVKKGSHQVPSTNSLIWSQT